VQQLQQQPRTREPVARARRDEMRTYGLGSQILSDLGVGKMRVLGHAMKVPGMSGFGLEIVEYIEQGIEANNKKATR
jgi:3,4-dihydroxy 2-butanone 4-phosphate synthase/GTP cyclohydrolase II